MTGSTITQAVRSLYEAFPYPHYPLLAKPRWQEGYAASAAFARALLGHPGERPTKPSERLVLIGGSGEILPYVVRRWEARGRGLACLDLSATSLRRARFRLGLRAAGMRFVRGDLALVLAQEDRLYEHMDFYGVLHHMGDPSAALRLAARRLAPGGTMRVMVYNSKARAWIHELQRVFARLGYDHLVSSDVRDARRFLLAIAGVLPRLAARLKQMGDATLRNDARFVDTFLHAREARLSLTHWQSTIDAAGLQTYALFDRYAELDDLANPLWQAPSVSDLEARADDLRYENNLEVFLVKPPRGKPTVSSEPATCNLHYALTLAKGPPKLWFGFAETKTVPQTLRFELWRAYLQHVLLGAAPKANVFGRVDWRALQRLARIGAVLPGMVQDEALRATLLAPMADAMQAPELPARLELPSKALSDLVETALAVKNREDSRAHGLILHRLLRI